MKGRQVAYMVALQKQRSEGQSFGGGPVNGLACLKVLHWAMDAAIAVLDEAQTKNLRNSLLQGCTTSPLPENTKNPYKEKYAADKISWMTSVEGGL